jgi:hypothetical protein
VFDRIKCKTHPEPYSQRYANIRLIKGVPVPVGWSGKQYACYQLAQQSNYEAVAR